MGRKSNSRPGRRVGEQHSLPPIDRDHALDHPAEHGGLSFVARGELCDAIVEFLTEAIELAGELAQFVAVGYI